jgi:DNA-binding protein YbaB
MNKETYKKAHELQEKISQLEYDIKLLKEQLSSNNLLIRFGGQFNVSAPIEVDPIILDRFGSDIIKQKNDILNELKQQFNEL